MKNRQIERPTTHRTRRGIAAFVTGALVLGLGVAGIHALLAGASPTRTVSDPSVAAAPALRVDPVGWPRTSPRPAYTRPTPTVEPTVDPNALADGVYPTYVRAVDIEGATVTIDTSFAAPANVPTRITVLGSDGVLESVGDQRITLRTNEGSSEVFAFDAPAEDPHLVPMRAWAQVVRDAVREGKVPDHAPTFTDGVECARVMDLLRA